MAIDSLPPSPAGELLHGEVRVRINEVIDTVNILSTSQDLPYIFNGDTDDSDPGIGQFKLNNVDPALATFVYVSNYDVNTVDLGPIARSINRGDYLFVQNQNDSSSHQISLVTNPAIDATTYVKIPIVNVSGAGTLVAGAPTNARWYATGDRKANITGILTGTIPLSADSSSPTIITGWQDYGIPLGLEFDAPTGAMRNISGRNFSELSGVVSFQVAVSGGGNGAFNLASQRSSDGVVWTYNPSSLRGFDTSNLTNTVKTSISLIENFNDGDYVRWVAYATGNSQNITEYSAVFEGNTISGFSGAWSLREG